MSNANYIKLMESCLKILVAILIDFWAMINFISLMEG